MRKRRKAAAGDPAPDAGTPAAGEPEAGAAEDLGPRAGGPWDASEKPVTEDDPNRIDLGGLSVEGSEQLEVRLQVDEASGQVQAAMLVAADGAMEVRAFAAARNEDLWEEVRPRMAEETARRGGRAQEVPGPFGPALHLLMPGAAPDGQQVAQPSTVLGVAGPRWMLRVMMFGRPAREYHQHGVLETALRSIVVNRGSQPMAPGDAIPLRLPAGARRVERPGDRPPSPR